MGPNSYMMTFKWCKIKMKSHTVFQPLPGKLRSNIARCLARAEGLERGKGNCSCFYWGSFPTLTFLPALTSDTSFLFRPSVLAVFLSRPVSESDRAEDDWWAWLGLAPVSAASLNQDQRCGPVSAVLGNPSWTGRGGTNCSKIRYRVTLHLVSSVNTPNLGQGGGRYSTGVEIRNSVNLTERFVGYLDKMRTKKIFSKCVKFCIIRVPDFVVSSI